MMNRSHVFALLFLTAPSLALFAQAGTTASQTTPQNSPPALPHPQETLMVLGSATPAPLAESSASVEDLPVEENRPFVDGPLDLLRAGSSVLIEQRGAGGAQSDLTLRGGGFGQTLVLVNGFRVNDSQTGHNTLDLPIPMEAMRDLQVLRGAGSTLHGADALSGVVDFLTAAPSNTSLLLRAGAGSFGLNEESAMASLARGRESARLTAGRNLSTGFMTDRDYRNENASLENWFATRLGVTDLLVAASDRAFGANQFYGNYNSWERTKGWFASARQELGAHTTAAFGYRRHTDEFILLRNLPSVYENNHADSSWQASMRRTFAVRADALILAGLDADGDAIESSNLGRHERNRGAGYADFDLRPAKRRWTLAAGAREEILSGGNTVFAPHLAGNMRVLPTLKVRASSGYGFRLPTYTDLYYSDPSTVGNAALKPESAWSADGGADWAASTKIELSATYFYNRQHNTIDYERASASLPWQAVNLHGPRFQGVETAARWQPAKGQSLRLNWTAMQGSAESLNGMLSKYVANYPEQNVSFTWTATLGRWATMSNTVEAVTRHGQDAYATWSGGVSRDAGRLRPYLRFMNLGNTCYEEVSGVAMPGRGFTGGITVLISR